MGCEEMWPRARRTCAYTRETRASGATRRPVGHQRRGRALLSQRVERPGDLTGTCGNRAPLACTRVADVVRCLRVEVRAPKVLRGTIRASV